MKEPKFEWIEKFQLWDCTDGEIHGGGKTKEEALKDYQQAMADEAFEATVGWVVSR